MTWSCKVGKFLFLCLACFLTGVTAAKIKTNLDLNKMMDQDLSSFPKEDTLDQGWESNGIDLADGLAHLHEMLFQNDGDAQTGQDRDQEINFVDAIFEDLIKSITSERDVTSANGEEDKDNQLDEFFGSLANGDDDLVNHENTILKNDPSGQETLYDYDNAQFYRENAHTPEKYENLNYKRESLDHLFKRGRMNYLFKRGGLNYLFKRNGLNNLFKRDDLDVFLKRGGLSYIFKRNSAPFLFKQ